jgi:hypothetical protein
VNDQVNGSEGISFSGTEPDRRGLCAEEEGSFGNICWRRAKSFVVGGEEMSDATSADRSRNGKYTEGGKAVNTAGAIPASALDVFGEDPGGLEGAEEFANFGDTECFARSYNSAGVRRGLLLKLR